MVEGEREGSLRPGEESVFSFWRYFYFKLIGPPPVGMAPHGFVPANLMGEVPGRREGWGLGLGKVLHCVIERGEKDKETPEQARLRSCASLQN